MDCGRRWIAPGDGSRPEMDRGQRWIAAREGLRPEMDDERWIPSGDGSRQDMDLDRIWMDDRRRMTGEGSQEMDHGRRMTINLLPFHEDIEVIRSYTLLEITTLISNYATTQLQWNADLQTYGVPAAWLHRVRCRELLRALLRALFRDTESCTYMPGFQCRIQSRIRSRVTATMPIPHKPYEINLWRSNDL
jgi:hypothetical protein